MTCRSSSRAVYGPLAGPLRAVRGAALLLVLAASLAAFLWHALLLQTHRHDAPSRPSMAVSQVLAPGGTSQFASASEAVEVCAICQILSASAEYLPPASIWAIVLAGAVVAVSLLPWRVAFAPVRSHAWRSRAPPSAAYA